MQGLCEIIEHTENDLHEELDFIFQVEAWTVG
jgi:hypothetical protein